MRSFIEDSASAVIEEFMSNFFDSFRLSSLLWETLAASRLKRDLREVVELDLLDDSQPFRFDECLKNQITLKYSWIVYDPLLAVECK